MKINMKPTLVIGASTKPERYAFKAITALKNHLHPVVAFGQRGGVVAGVSIETEWNPTWEVDTVTLYINPVIQESYYERILALKPKRVIFNPGTENHPFENELRLAGIEAEESCTLVLLSIGQY
jgi:predicted CoA-binding protein